LKPM